MKIETFEYHDKSRDWKLEKTSFSDLNLLVGVSGVGKTQILNALLNLKKIAEGESINGVKWDIVFTTNDNSRYRWCGEFEVKKILNSIESQYKNGGENSHIEKTDILNEYLYLNENEIIRRNQEGVYFNGTKTPKISSKKSAVSVFKDESIEVANNVFHQIIISASKFSLVSLPIYRLEDIGMLFDEFEMIQDSFMEIWEKLLSVYKFYPKIFEEIKSRFIEIFPQVIDLKYELVKNNNEIIFSYNTETPILMVKEKDVSNWIDQFHMSEGMLRTLHHIAELYLCPNGSVILIDEFENSLGVNCIDVITEDILTQNRDLQFIITSHHPYIINNIPPKYWKIVQRKGGVVSTHDAASLGLSDSNHEAFIQLINSDKFREGIEAA